MMVDNFANSYIDVLALSTTAITNPSPIGFQMFPRHYAFLKTVIYKLQTGLQSFIIFLYVQKVSSPSPFTCQPHKCLCVVPEGGIYTKTLRYIF